MYELVIIIKITCYALSVISFPVTFSDPFPFTFFPTSIYMSADRMLHSQVRASLLWPVIQCPVC